MSELNELRERLVEQEKLTGLLLEMVHQIVIDAHAPKAMWDRVMIPAWKAHIEKKREKEKPPV